MIPRFGVPLVTFALVAAATACAADGSTLDLTPAGAAGHEVARQKGCAACHGSSGQGGVGPAFTDLTGSTVELADGTTVIADEEYLRRAIVDPAAEIVDGYRITMPQTKLTDEEVDSLITYINELSGDTGTGGSTP